jgi:hypothetical protein
VSTQLRLIKGSGGQGARGQSGRGQSGGQGSAVRGTRANAARRHRRPSRVSGLGAYALADLRLDAQTRDRGIQGVAEARRRLASLQPPESSLSQAS